MKHYILRSGISRFLVEQFFHFSFLKTIPLILILVFVSTGISASSEAEVICVSYKVPSKLEENKLENVPWCWKTTSEMDGDKAWRTCKFNVLPVTRNTNILNHGDMWLNCREAFPGAGIYSSVESLFPFYGTHNTSFVMDGVYDELTFKEMCLATNFSSKTINPIPCLGELLPTLCAEGSLSVILSSNASNRGECYDGSIAPTGDQNPDRLTAEPLKGCFQMQEVTGECSSGVGIVVNIPTETKCTQLKNPREIWYNGLLNTPELWKKWSKGRMCMLCRHNKDSSRKVSRMELQLRLKETRDGIFLESFPVERGLLEPRCFVNNKTNFIGTANETSKMLAGTPFPTIIWCFQRSIDGTFAISNRIIYVPNDFQLVLQENAMPPDDHGYQWNLRNGSHVVLKYRYTDPGPNGTIMELNINGGCNHFLQVDGKPENETASVIPQVSCLRRLCLAASGCRSDAICNDEFCGPFALPRRHPKFFALSTRNQDDFKKCAEDMVCASEAIWFILPSNDCDEDGKIDCEDRACNLNKILNPEFPSRNESKKEYMTAFMARYWKISNDRGGEPVQLVSGNLFSCAHNMLYGRQRWRQPVRKGNFEIIDMGNGSAILPTSRDSPNKEDNIFLETINVKSLLLVPPRNKSKIYSDDPLAGDNLDILIDVSRNEKFKLLNALKIQDVIDELKNATETVGSNSTADDETLFNKTRIAEGVLVKTQGESSRILEEIPDNLEVMWGRAKLPENGTRKQVENILAIGAVEGNVSRGIMLHCPEECDYLNISKLEIISHFDDPDMENVEAGALLPKNTSRTDVRYTFSAYRDAAAFGFGKNGEAVFEESQEGSEWRLHSVITMFSMWSTNGTQLQLSPGENVNITLRPRNYSNNGLVGPKICVSRQNSNGTWTNKNCELLPGTKFDICQCKHLTHFVLLVDVTQKGADSKALEIISVVGCTMSLCGILGIIFIAAYVPHWRKKTENKVLLNLTTAVALMMVAFLAATYTKLDDKKSCTALGAVLHFAVLATFLWSMAAAITHYLRFATILGPSIVSRLPLKAGLVSWGLPLVSVAVVASVWPESYSRREKNGLCYPKELAFYVTVLGPIAIVLTVNMILFILILRTIGVMSCMEKGYSMKVGETRQSREAKRRIMLRKTLACVAFIFLFGLTWLLGIYSFSIVCTFFVCLITSLQGVVLFVFFAAGEQRVRQQLNRRFRRTAIARMIHGGLQPFTRFGAGGTPSSSTTQPNVMTVSFSSEAKPAPPTYSTNVEPENS